MRLLLALLFAITLAGCGTKDTEQNPGPIIPPSQRRGSGTLSFVVGLPSEIAIKGFTTFQASVGQIVVSDSANPNKAILFLLPGLKLPRSNRTYTLVDGDSTAGATQARLLVSDLSDGMAIGYYSQGGEQVTLTVGAGRRVSCTIPAAAMRANTFINPAEYLNPGTLATTFTFIAEESMFE